MSETKLFAVTGNPILHSKSPCMFNNAFESMNLEARYIRIAADSATEAIYLFNKTELSGMNVTAPFKEDIMPFLDIIDDDAQKIGSVNTVVKKDGKLIGYNTDHYGVANSIIEADISLKDINAVVIGAGGAGKAAAFGLVKNGAKVTIVNRTLAKAKAAAQTARLQI
ncbi:MAG: hypothetical protein IPO21_21710 [Bacteroidales bacterium]|nr:hypothetical protein [Bacteroidales bacterium]